MTTAKVGLDGAFFRPVNDPYATGQEGWGKPQGQAWWASYNVGINQPTNSTPTGISTGTLLNGVWEGLSAWASPRKVNESSTTIKTPKKLEFLPNASEKMMGSTPPLETKPATVAQPTTQTMPPVTTATQPTLPLPTAVAQPSTTVPALAGGVQPAPNTVQTVMPNPTLPATVGVMPATLPATGALMNPTTVASQTVTVPPADAMTILMAQITALKTAYEQSSQQVSELSTKIDTQSKKIEELTTASNKPPEKEPPASAKKEGIKTSTPKKTQKPNKTGKTDPLPPKETPKNK